MTGVGRRAWLVVAVAGAMAVVTIAAGAGEIGAPAGSAEGFAAILADVLPVVVLAYAALTLGIFVWVMVGQGPGGTPRKRVSLWARVASILVVLLVLAAASLAREPDGELVDDGPPGSFVDDVPAPSSGSPGGRGGGGAGGWVVGALGLALVVVVVVAARRRPPVGETVDVDSPIPTQRERDDAVARARACADPREAVLLAFAAAEAVLSVADATRRPPATSAREWVRAVRTDGLDVIVDRYEIARFSDHDVDADDRAVALAALDRLVAGAVATA